MIEKSVSNTIEKKSTGSPEQPGISPLLLIMWPYSAETQQINYLVHLEGKNAWLQLLSSADLTIHPTGIRALHFGVVCNFRGDRNRQKIAS